jgi:hypothetical protein
LLLFGELHEQPEEEPFDMLAIPIPGFSHGAGGAIGSYGGGGGAPGPAIIGPPPNGVTISIVMYFAKYLPTGKTFAKLDCERRNPSHENLIEIS